MQLLRKENLRVSFKFEPRDLWIGVYWDQPDIHPVLGFAGINIYVCILPTLPIKFEYYWELKDEQ